jgi:rhodanese-related sulfurtransferase
MAGKRYEALIERLEAEVPHPGPADLDRAPWDGALLVDVRQPDEHAADAIPGSINLPRPKLEAQIEDHLEHPDQPVVTYCGSRGRSTLAGWALREMGLQAGVLAGGSAAWRQASGE